MEPFDGCLGLEQDPHIVCAMPSMLCRLRSAASKSYATPYTSGTHRSELSLI
jgi:hypothetical protein